MGELKIKVKAGFLILPVGEFVGSHRINVIRNGMVEDDFTLRLDYRNPVAYSYYPIGKYMGEEITLAVSPDMDLCDMQTDTPRESDNGENFRPFIHFTAKYGWINDPNGLLKYTSPVTGRTTYHMFYQFNPYDWVWGNMHWGHAVSEDLFRWKRLEPALCPDEYGTVFSGSAIVDKENRSGLKTGDEDVILLFYTCAGNTSYRSAGKKFTQCLAYSNDGGATFKKYENNPVVGHIAADNRDPKVVWCSELGKYVMALYLERDEYMLLTSDNLLKWEEYERLHIERDCECPDFYPLSVKGRRMWVLSGAAHHYMIGEFVNGKFKIIQNSRLLSYGNSSYAAQTFSTDNENERIQIAWDRNHSFGSAHFCGQMSIPCEISLSESDDDYYLCATPVSLIETLRRDKREYRMINIDRDKPMTDVLEESAYELDLIFEPSQLSSDVVIGLFDQQIVLKPALNTVNVGSDSVPMTMSGRKAELKFIIDKGGAEIFSCENRAILTTPWTLNFNCCDIKISSDSKAVIEKLTLTKLSL